MSDFNEKLAAFAARLEKHRLLNLIRCDVDCEANRANCKVNTHIGKKYARVDERGSGRFMVEISTGIIYGIKGYGQVHKGHAYGTLDTINDYYWGEYRGTLLADARRSFRGLPEGL